MFNMLFSWHFQSVDQYDFMSDQVDSRQKFLFGRSTIPNVHRDFHEWHLGRPRYAVWAIDADFPEIRRPLAAAKVHLEEFMLEAYCRQPHITLSTCGFLSDNPGKPDDFDLVRFVAQVSALRQLNLRPFEIQLASLSSFSLAPFFHVTDADDYLSKLHHCLRANVCKHDDVEYIPHVTVGLYSAIWPADVVINRMESFLSIESPKLLVNTISLMTYQTSKLGGALTTVANYHLEDGRVEWFETMPFKC